MIEVRNLVKKYDNHLALDNLSFTVEENTVFGFLGPNGAGKSTTMNIITGYAEPALLEDNSGIAVQFERLGYFVKDQDSTPEKFVFNKTTGLKDTFKK